MPWGVLVVPGVVLVVVLGLVVVVVGVVVVVFGLVVCVPIPVLGVTVPVFCAVAMPTAIASTDDANKIFRIEDAPCREFPAAERERRVNVHGSISEIRFPKSDAAQAGLGWQESRAASASPLFIMV